MDLYTTRRTALQALIHHLGGRGAIAAIHKKTGIDASYISRLLYDEGKPGGKNMGEDIALALQKAYPDFFQGDNSLFSVITFSNVEPGRVVEAIDVVPQPGYVRLEHLSPTPSMGIGNELEEPTHIVQYLDVLEDWVRRKVGTTDPRRIKVLTGVGRSMRPTIEDEDLVFVDTGCCEIDHPDIYVIAVGKRLLLKRALILVGDQTLVLRSDNTEEFPDEERIPLKKSESIHVAGRVKAWWTLRK